jgi:hypothetical protein
MNTQLQQAMAAVKAEPNNANSWFLLSQAVETDKERAKLLRKVLSLSPNHPAARDQLDRLTAPPAEETRATPLPVSTNPLDYLAQSEADTIPPWMAGDTAVTTKAVAEPPPAAPAIPKEAIPSWLQEEPNQDWFDKEEDKTGRVVWKAGQDGQGQEEVAAETPPRPEKAPAKAKQPAAPTSFWTSNAFVALLAIVAVLVLIAIVVLLVSP